MIKIPHMQWAGLVAAVVLSAPQAGLAQGQTRDSAADQAASHETKVEQGRKLAFTRSKGNCLACHQIQGGDLAGRIGPPLVNIKQRFPNRQQLVKRIWDETQYNPMTVMPPFGRHLILDKPEIQKIVDFLYTL